MTTLPSIDHAHLPLGKRGAFEGVARWPWMAGGMGTDDAQNPGNHQPHHNPQRWVEKCDRSVANSETPQISRLRSRIGVAGLAHSAGRSVASAQILACCSSVSGRFTAWVARSYSSFASAS